MYFDLTIWANNVILEVLSTEISSSFHQGWIDKLVFGIKYILLSFVELKLFSRSTSLANTKCLQES